MNGNESKTLTRDVEAAVVPVGTKVTLMKGEQAHITQSLGGTYTVIVNGNMFRIESKDADALGLEAQATPVSAAASGPVTQEQLEKQVWDALKTCYDPEIPVNVVDLGLIYDCHLTPIGGKQFQGRCEDDAHGPRVAAWGRCSRRTCKTNCCPSNRLTRRTWNSSGTRRGIRE
jgi:hypothetical protein